jgi:O-acetylhomoserine (thiol)-lyase
MSRGITTTVLHSDRTQEIEHGAVHKPMHPAVSYRYGTAEQLAEVFQGSRSGFSYARQGTPTTTALENKITRLEDGVATVSFATGMAALTAIFTTLLRAGDHIISSRHIFGNTTSLFGTLQGLGVDVELVDATDVANVTAAIRPETRMVFTETIANPGTQVADLAAIGTLCRERSLLYVVDNTLTSPWLFRAKAVGAGLVMNSLTKYIGGHGNALGGTVTDTGLFDWSALQIRKKGLRDMGATLSSEAAHRIAVGAETLALRMQRSCSNALALAQMLTAHPGVSKVHYPGLPQHAQHARAGELFGTQGSGHGAGYGALLSLELADGIDCFAFLNTLELVILATHLGDNRTLALPAAHTIYFEMGAERRAQMGIADSLIRVSVGIEDEVDLLGDFKQALDAQLAAR